MKRILAILILFFALLSKPANAITVTLSTRYNNVYIGQTVLSAYHQVTLPASPPTGAISTFGDQFQIISADGLSVFYMQTNRGGSNCLLGVPAGCYTVEFTQRGHDGVIHEGIVILKAFAGDTIAYSYDGHESDASGSYGAGAGYAHVSWSNNNASGLASGGSSGTRYFDILWRGTDQRPSGYTYPVISISVTSYNPFGGSNHHDCTGDMPIAGASHVTTILTLSAVTTVNGTVFPGHLSPYALSAAQLTLNPPSCNLAVTYPYYIGSWQYSAVTAWGP